MIGRCDFCGVIDHHLVGDLCPHCVAKHHEPPPPAIPALAPIAGVSPTTGWGSVRRLIDGCTPASTWTESTPRSVPRYPAWSRQSNVSGAPPCRRRCDATDLRKQEGRRHESH